MGYTTNLNWLAGFQPSTVWCLVGAFNSNLQMARPNLQTPGAPAGHCLIEEGPSKKRTSFIFGGFSPRDLGNIDRKHVM